jgi:hypothetical protein
MSNTWVETGSQSGVLKLPPVILQRCHNLHNLSMDRIHVWTFVLVNYITYKYERIAVIRVMRNAHCEIWIDV